MALLLPSTPQTVQYVNRAEAVTKCWRLSVEIPALLARVGTSILGAASRGIDQANHPPIVFSWMPGLLLATGCFPSSSSSSSSSESDIQTSRFRLSLFPTLRRQSVLQYGIIWLCSSRAPTRCLYDDVSCTDLAVWGLRCDINARILWRSPVLFPVPDGCGTCQISPEPSKRHSERKIFMPRTPANNGSPAYIVRRKFAFVNSGGCRFYDGKL